MSGNPLDLPGAPKPGTILCALDDIPDPGAKGFVFGSGIERFEMFVVREGGTFYAYVNSCPHGGTPLDFSEDHFLTAEKDLILCSTHGARFRIHDGFCVGGPCEDEALKPLPITVKGGHIVVGAVD